MEQQYIRYANLRGVSLIFPVETLPKVIADKLERYMAQGPWEYIETYTKES